jgi:RNA polymerase sigma-70 factor (ECF subfamily)
VSESNIDLVALVQQGFRFALALTHDRAQADDLVQDACLALARGSRAPDAAYFLTVIRNRFVDLHRRSRLAAFEALPEDMAALDGADDGAIEINVEELDTALGRLLPEERAALLLVHVEDWPVQRVAELFEWPRGTALSVLHRARRKMQAELQERGARTT